MTRGYEYLLAGCLPLSRYELYPPIHVPIHAYLPVATTILAYLDLPALYYKYMLG